MQGAGCHEQYSHSPIPAEPEPAPGAYSHDAVASCVAPGTMEHLLRLGPVTHAGFGQTDSPTCSGKHWTGWATLGQ